MTCKISRNYISLSLSISWNSCKTYYGVNDKLRNLALVFTYIFLCLLAHSSWFPKLPYLLGIPISQQHLIWQSTDLQDDFCLHDYGYYDLFEIFNSFFRSDKE